MSSEKKQALNGSRINAFMMDPTALTIIGLDTKDGPEHPLWDARAVEPLEENAILNVMALGVLEPVLVRKNGDVVEVIAGRHRVRWAREANLRLAKLGSELIRVPVMTPRKDDDAGHMGVMISENEIRNEDSVQARAEKALRLSNFGKTPRQIAVLFGVSEQAVNGWLAFNTLAPEVKAEVEAGTLAPSSAVHLAELPHTEQVETVTTLVKEAKANGKKNGSKPVAVKGKDVKATVEKKKAAKKATPEADTTKTGTAVGRKLCVAIWETGADDLDPAFIKGLKFAMGEIGADKVAGLLKVIRKIDGARAEAGKGLLYAAAAE